MPMSGNYFYPGVQSAFLGYKATKLLNLAALSSVPVNNDTSGSIYWLADAKYLVVYGPLGWTRILTGSNPP